VPGVASHEKSRVPSACCLDDCAECNAQPSAGVSRFVSFPAAARLAETSPGAVASSPPAPNRVAVRVTHSQRLECSQGAACDPVLEAQGVLG
jgi:hypothetical protein